MSRRGNRADVDWETPAHPNWTWEHVQIEVLMDIRQELRAIRHVLQCPNVARGFIAMAKIEKRLAKRLPLRTGKAK